MRYVDFDGTTEIDLDTFGRKYEDLAGRTLQRTTIRTTAGQHITIRTIWTGLHDPTVCARPFGVVINIFDRDPSDTSAIDYTATIEMGIFDLPGQAQEFFGTLAEELPHRSWHELKRPCH